MSIFFQDDMLTPTFCYLTKKTKTKSVANMANAHRNVSDSIFHLRQIINNQYVKVGDMVKFQKKNRTYWECTRITHSIITFTYLINTMNILWFAEQNIIHQIQSINAQF